jgi:hypothetical protein
MANTRRSNGTCLIALEPSRSRGRWPSSLRGKPGPRGSAASGSRFPTVVCRPRAQATAPRPRRPRQLWRPRLVRSRRPARRGRTRRHHRLGRSLRSSTPKLRRRLLLRVRRHRVLDRILLRDAGSHQRVRLERPVREQGYLQLSRVAAEPRPVLLVRGARRARVRVLPVKSTGVRRG